ncbi:hypothetical protein CBR_g19869 [Chara braunii]|uniref:Uncharacterized protein n=1 Tax=Chara braunii TaxID=69332 RepID=A0A388KZ53_CHABU|nr:hypothetical protein CBR_g19869 [Chara braunii]|eukprot:GBG75233.1 hypothetical protein CBR_g19869 [Chara braunii]
MGAWPGYFPVGPWPAQGPYPMIPQNQNLGGEQNTGRLQLTGQNQAGSCRQGGQNQNRSQGQGQGRGRGRNGGRNQGPGERGAGNRGGGNQGRNWGQPQGGANPVGQEYQQGYGRGYDQSYGRGYGRGNGQWSGQGYGRGWTDYRECVCTHCAIKGHTVKRCHVRKLDKRERLITSNMEGEVFDQNGRVIDPEIPGGTREEALRVAALGPNAPGMFRIWQEREEPVVQVEDITDLEEEVSRMGIGEDKGDVSLVEEETEEEDVRTNVRDTFDTMGDLVDKMQRLHLRLRGICEEAGREGAGCPKVFTMGHGGSGDGPNEPNPRMLRANMAARNSGSQRSMRGTIPFATRRPATGNPQKEQAKASQPAEEEPPITVEGDEDENEKIREEEERQAEIRAKRRKDEAKEGRSKGDTGLSKKRKYQTAIEEGVDLEGLGVLVHVWESEGAAQGIGGHRRDPWKEEAMAQRGAVAGPSGPALREGRQRRDQRISRNLEELPIYRVGDSLRVFLRDLEEYAVRREWGDREKIANVSGAGMCKRRIEGVVTGCTRWKVCKERLWKEMGVFPRDDVEDDLRFDGTNLEEFFESLQLAAERGEWNKEERKKQLIARSKESEKEEVKGIVKGSRTWKRITAELWIAYTQVRQDQTRKERLQEKGLWIGRDVAEPQGKEAKVEEEDNVPLKRLKNKTRVSPKSSSKGSEQAEGDEQEEEEAAEEKKRSIGASMVPRKKKLGKKMTIESGREEVQERRSEKGGGVKEAREGKNVQEGGKTPKVKKTEEKWSIGNRERKETSGIRKKEDERNAQVKKLMRDMEEMKEEMKGLKKLKEKLQKELLMEAGGDGVAIITVKNPPVNALAPEILRGLKEKFDEANRRNDVKAIVVTGADGKFSGGFDINAIVEQQEKGSVSGSLGQVSVDLFVETIENSTKPVVAAMEGLALGGGLELAMSCHARICAPKTQLGLPELQLGIIPGFGGTQRLPRLVGVQRAIEMMLLSKTMLAEEGKERGLIDLIVPQREVLGAARKWALDIVDRRRPRMISLTRNDILEPLGDARLILKFARAQALKTAPHLKHPHLCLDVVEHGIEAGGYAGNLKEAEVFKKLVVSDTAKSLTHIFFAQRMTTRVAGVTDRGLKPRPIKRVAVVGGGLMGSGICTAMIMRKVPVILKEVNSQFLEQGMQRIKDNLNSRVKKGKMTEEQFQKTLGLVKPALDYNDFGSVDMVIEAVIESIPLKQQIFGDLQRHCSPSCILATNTSTIDINVVGEKTNAQDRILGAHFFSPAHVMPLLEIVRTDKTSAQVIVDVLQLGKVIQKVPVVVGNCTGFALNRVFFPYTMAASLLVDLGVDPYRIDKVIAGFGMPMGPFRLADLVGMQVSLAVGQQFKNAYSERSYASTLVPSMVKDERLGEKTKKGFYLYDAKRKASPDPELKKYLEASRKASNIMPNGKPVQVTDKEILEMIFFPVVNEACRVMDERIVGQASDLDIATVLSFGFPPYRGGLVWWADTVGAKYISSQLSKWSQVIGPGAGFFKPSTYLEQRASRGIKLGAPAESSASTSSPTSPGRKPRSRM